MNKDVFGYWQQLFFRRNSFLEIFNICFNIRIIYICHLTRAKDTTMTRIGLIRESKTPADNRVALTPAQCKWILKNAPQVSITVQPSPHRCFSDREYIGSGAELKDDLSDCDILLGIKEVP